MTHVATAENSPVVVLLAVGKSRTLEPVAFEEYRRFDTPACRRAGLRPWPWPWPGLAWPEAGLA